MTLYVLKLYALNLARRDMLTCAVRLSEIYQKRVKASVCRRKITQWQRMSLFSLNIFFIFHE